MSRPQVTIQMDAMQAVLLGKLLGKIGMQDLGDYPKQFVDLHRNLTGMAIICGAITVRGDGDGNRTIDMREEL